LTPLDRAFEGGHIVLAQFFVNHDPKATAQLTPGLQQLAEI
jgi:hypothetical protein